MKDNQLPLELGPEDFGEKGKRAWFWQDGQWQVGRAWAVLDNGRVAGMCRDYGPWGTPYAGSMPLQTHGTWPASEVCWKKPSAQYERPTEVLPAEPEAA